VKRLFPDIPDCLKLERTISQQYGSVESSFYRQQVELIDKPNCRLPIYGVVLSIKRVRIARQKVLDKASGESTTPYYHCSKSFNASRSR
jgi:hypothetical protein